MVIVLPLMTFFHMKQSVLENIECFLNMLYAKVYGKVTEIRFFDKLTLLFGNYREFLTQNLI